MNRKSGANPLRRLSAAFRYSCQGLAAAARHEPAFRYELLVALVTIPVALWLPLSALERVALIGSVLLTLIVELINSAIEAIVDRVSTEHHPLAGRAKDLGSAAVMLTAALAAIAWLAIAGPVVLGMFF